MADAMTSVHFIALYWSGAYQIERRYTPMPTTAHIYYGGFELAL